MQKLQCELCGSIDIIKTEENVFQCQHCGCKYTLEQAKTLIFGGEVKTKATDFEITGGVLKKYNGEDIDVIVPDNVLEIGTSAFEKLQIRSVQLPRGLKEIDCQAFFGCENLASVSIPQGTKSIDDSAFDSCTALTSVQLSEGINQIGNEAFQGCISLQSVAIPKGITRIENFTFKDCKKLSSVQLPKGLSEIGCEAFAGCSSLKTISPTAGLKRIEDRAFSDCVSLKDMYVPDGVNADGADLWGKFTTIFQGCNMSNISTPYIRQEWRRTGRCQHCGGAFKGFFNQVCTKCSRARDY